ncbi:MAG TPA: DNA repair exonuclease [Anaerolineae bacterium]|nr:DNA repair exonuclease [Anaerolineae bacterium]HQI87035.1 DNA repair exonuclease [Anaerolineae bacterium]
MSFKFLHLSDIHLGYQQYGSRDRFNDFGRAFLAAMDEALAQRVDLVVISGDFFHKSAIDPPTLLQAVNGLDKLRQQNISVAAIAGNHDKARYRDSFSWLDFLAERDYLALLSPTFAEDGMHLLPWDGHEGAYLDLGPVRVIGVPYLASIRPVIAQLPAALAALPKTGTAYTMLLAHAGIEGEMPGIPSALTYDELSPLRDLVNYLALGHLHKPFEQAGWIYNPGSLEVCGMDERRWKGGCYLVTVNPDSTPAHIVEHLPSKRRPFHRVTFMVDTYTTPENLYAALRAQLEMEAPLLQLTDQKPVVELSLEGVLAFDRLALDPRVPEKLIEDIVQPLIGRVQEDRMRTADFAVTPETGLELGDLERSVLEQLIVRDGRYARQSDAWAELMLTVKQITLAGSEPKTLAATVRQRMIEIQEVRDVADGD